MATLDDDAPQQKPPSPPPHLTFQVRGVHVPSFSAFHPRDLRLPSHQGMTHVSWSCDGRKLAAVGIDKVARVWQPEKSMEPRASSLYSGGHSEEIDYVSFNPTHPELFCTSSEKERKIVFWDARQSRNVQSLPVKVAPKQLSYSPDGRTMAWTTVQHQLCFLELGREAGETKDQWRGIDRLRPAGSDRSYWPATGVIFNHDGSGLVLATQGDHLVRVVDYPSLDYREGMAAHVTGGISMALDPRGRYLATGGADTMINLYETDSWICSQTIVGCDYSINGLSFSHDGEFIAVATQGTMMDIYATETGEVIHRATTQGPTQSIAWHPSKHLIAYCGQTPRTEMGPAPVATLSLFGLGP